jgi:transmembrane sensor
VHDSERAALEQEALRWLSRLTSGAATDADRDGLLRWRARSVDHEQAFQGAVRLWKQLGDAAEVQSAPPRRAFVSRRRFLQTGAMAAGIGGVAIAGAKLGFWPGMDELLADYSTAAGEQRRVALTERVDIELNTRSALSINTETDRANVRLSAGEAVFTVKPGASRFVVAAGGGHVGAERGTFVVRHEDGRVRMTCLDGAVEVLEPERLRLNPLEQVVCSGKNLGSIVRVSDGDSVAGWRRGVLTFRHEPLGAVISELNRYRKGLIVVTSRSVAERRVTGVFHLDRIDETLDHIQQTLNVQIHRFSPYFVVVG